MPLISAQIAHGSDTEEQTATSKIAEASASTPEGKLFILKSAPLVPSLEAGGFAFDPGFADDFSPGWPEMKMGWQVATWKQNGTKMAKERARVNDAGHLVLTVMAGKPDRGGSVQTTREFGYGRWIARVRPSSVPGLLNSVFTKDWDNLQTPEDRHDGKKAEVDIEFVTSTFGDGKGEVHLAIHLKDHMPLWHLDIPLDFDPSAEFHEWGFDILPDRVVWHVDGRQLHVWKYTAEHQVDPDYEFFFNAWTRAKWLEGPPAENADYHIDWVKFYPITGPGAAPISGP